MVDKLFDIFGGSSIISGVILSLYQKMQEVTDPLTIVLNILLLVFGLFYVISRWRGRCIENKIRKFRWEQLQKEKEEDQITNSRIRDESF